MLDNQVIRLAGPQSCLYVVQPFMGKAGIHGVHDSRLFIQDDIGIISHAVFYDILAFKEIDFMVIDTHVFNIVCNFHLLYTPLLFNFIVFSLRGHYIICFRFLQEN